MAFSQLAARYEMFPREATVLCAVSGGADSMYLLERLRGEAERLGISVAAAHFDHRLRPSSGQDAQFVRQWCTERGIPCAVGSADVAEAARQMGRGVEETARMLRYEFLQQAAEELDAQVIATAHTADDNAETLLLNLTRGSGLDGLCGIPPRRGNVVRPLLDVTRAEIEAWLAARGVPHVEDESNADPRYTRNFIRHRVMPLLKEVNPQAVRHMTDAAFRLQDDRDVLHGQAQAVTEQAQSTEEGWRIPCSAFGGVPDAVAARAVRELARRAGGHDLTAAHLSAVIGLIRGEDPSAQVCLPGIEVRRVYEDLLFTSPQEEAVLEEIPLDLNGVTHWGGWTVECRRELRPKDAVDGPFAFWLSEAAFPTGLTLRSRREGDRLHPPGRVGKPVKKWLIDEKIPCHQRQSVPIAADGDRVAAVGGIGPEEKWLAQEGEAALHLILKPKEGAEHHAS